MTTRFSCKGQDGFCENATHHTAGNEPLAMNRKVLGNEHLDLAASLNGLACVLQDQANLDEAA